LAQVVTLAVYSYFAAALVGYQWIRPRHLPTQPVDLFYPFFLTIQFVFFFGWLKVIVSSFLNY
jgi:hypothetical protein